MEVGPPEPAVRGRLPTTASCVGQKPGGGALRKRRGLMPPGMARGGGVTLRWALARNVGACAPMRREKSKWEVPIRMRVPKRSAGAEQPVLGLRALKWSWTEGVALFSSGQGSTSNGRNPLDRAKPFDIPKREVWEAYKRVRANKGTAGVDGQSIADFEADLSNNLYKLWNRMSSGSYYPPPVRRVDIPKGDGRTRPLGALLRRWSSGSWSRSWSLTSTMTPMDIDPTNRRSMRLGGRGSDAGAIRGFLILISRPSSTASIQICLCARSASIPIARGCFCSSRDG